MIDDTEYHARRAADERRLAERSGVPAAALSHLLLARLHGARLGLGGRHAPATH